MSSNTISVCKWIESGTTVGTALPELANLTDDKKEWRAIIVRYIDDNSMAAFESDARNPFDFLINRNAADEDAIEESPIPLVRLTHMLGGLPPIDVKFRTEVLHEAHKAARTVYVPIEDKQKKQKHRDLAAKYEFDGKPPSSILIISIRGKDYKKESVESAWHTHHETASSEFWKRNRFPSICRFMVYDFENHGPIQREADRFGFWYSVMLMSINEWDSGVVQAYRLYSLGVSIDSSAMTESFQTLADRLRDTRHSIDKSIKKDIENNICTEEDLPEYRIEIPVSIKLPNTDERCVKETSFSLLSNGAISDSAIWSKQRNAAEAELLSLIRSAERKLDQTADKMRPNCTFTEDEVVPLTRYQVEDLTRETREIYRQIVQSQADLLNGNTLPDERIQKAAGKVQKNLLGRIKKRPAIIAVIIAAILMLVSGAPAIVDYFSKGAGSLHTFVHLFIICVVLIISSAFCVLSIQKAKLNALIEQYNRHLGAAFNKLVENAGDYSSYMSGIASYSRGSSYLNISARKKHNSATEHFLKYNHIKAVNILLDKLNTWSKAYHLDVDFTSKRPEIRVDFDVSVSPIENKAYAFETGATYPVAINNSGMSMNAPYSFVKQIIITREELYEDE